MSVVINGSTGISGVDGSAGTPAIQGTDANTGISFPAADTVAINTGGTERVRTDSSGRLLVGTSSAYTDVIAAAGGYSGPLWIASTGTANCGHFFSSWSSDAAVDPYGTSLILSRSKNGTIGSHTALSSGNAIGTISFNGSDGSKFVTGAAIKAEIDGGVSTSDLPSRLVFSTTADGASSPTERMRIDKDGLTNLYHTTDGFQSRSSQGAGTTYANFAGRYSATSTTNGTVSFVVYSNGNVENTNNSYTGISDIKLKENIVDASSQWDDIKALRPVNYNFKEGQTHTQLGLIAQEVELVSPGLVSESPDRDEEGNDLGTVTKSVNYSVLYMKAVKALQEAMERIEILEASNTDLLARVSALESA